MVNIDRVQELQPSFHGDYVVILTTGAQLTLSRGYRESIQDKLGTAF
jgi:two-component system LytT family response regulator